MLAPARTRSSSDCCLISAAFLSSSSVLTRHDLQGAVSGQLGGLLSEELLDRSEYDTDLSQAALSLLASVPSGTIRKLERQQRSARVTEEEQRIKRRERGSPVSALSLCDMGGATRAVKHHARVGACRVTCSESDAAVLAFQTGNCLLCPGARAHHGIVNACSTRRTRSCASSPVTLLARCSSPRLTSARAP